jgi:Xaa-Pro aminopeptidase
MPPKDPIVPIVEAKLEQVPALLTELGLDAWLVFVRESSVIHDPSLDLVVGTNVTWHSAFVLTAQGGRTAIVGQLDAANLRAHGHYPEVIPYTRGITEELRALLSRIDPRRVAINYSMSDPASDGLSHGMYLSLLRALEGTPYAARLESSTALVAALRGRKSALELERIRAACRATTAIFQRLTPWLRAGKSEKEVASRILDETSREAGLELAWDAEHCPSVFTGPDSAGAHAGPTDRKIEPGHLVNVDFGVRKDGYCSDLQRTWYFLRPGESKPPAEVRRGFATIAGAIRDGAKALRPGRQGVEVDGAVRGRITQDGYAEYAHGTGHQLGRAVHDGGGGLYPAWERYGDMPFLPVERGQCYTIEPRLTVAGHGIATCEEVVVVTESGGEFLSEAQEDVIAVGR